MYKGKVPTSDHHFTSSNPCVEFDAHNNGKWDLIDGYDDEEINAVFAEYNGITTTTTTATAIAESGFQSCPLVKTDFICKFPLIPRAENLRHFVSAERKKWRDAFLSCEMFRMSMATMKDLKANVALNELLIRRFGSL